MRVPMRGEVARLLPAGRNPYWRATITAIESECVPRAGAAPWPLVVPAMSGAGRRARRPDYAPGCSVTATSIDLPSRRTVSFTVSPTA